MAWSDPFPLTIEENVDMPALVFTYYPNGLSGPPFDFTGYTASAMFRENLDDAAATLTLAPALGGAAGTISVSISAAQASALVAAWSKLTGFWDILLTAPGGAKSHFFSQSPVTLIRSVTR